MKHLILSLLVFAQSLGFSQKQFILPKLKISPNIGMGWAIPPAINSGNSNLVLTPTPFQNYIIAEIATSSGFNKEIYKLTNTLGIDLNYPFSNQWSVNIGVNRAMHLHLFDDPDPIRTPNNIQYNTWAFAYKYTSFLFGVKYSRYSIFFQCNIHCAGKAKQAIESNNNNTGGVITNGNGLISTQIYQNATSFIISPEYGVSGFGFSNLPMDLSIGLNIPTSTFFKDKVSFFRNGSNAGENTLSFTQAALWLRARIPLTIWTKKEKPSNKPEISKPIPQKTVQYKGRSVTIGEKIILQNLQFDQSKSVLSPSAMSELDNVKQLMSQLPTITILIVGHTSDEGNRNTNVELSLNRAKACKEYLQKKGISPSRIQIRGMGPDTPISNTDKFQNRRVEMQIIKI